MTYQEYPKWVSGKEDEEPVLVHDAEEEAKVIGKSVASVQKKADANEQAGDEAQADEEERLLEEFRKQGSAVSESDIVEMTDLAAKVEERKKRGRPSKADQAARAAADAQAKAAFVPSEDINAK